VGDRGRYRVREGDVLVHSAFEAHLNRYDLCGSEVLTLAIPAQSDHASVLGRLSDPGYIMRLAERDKKEALAAAFATMTSAVATTFDWPDQLISDMQRNPVSMFAKMGDGAQANRLCCLARLQEGVRPQSFGIPG
jgi:hypothetical protein